MRFAYAFLIAAGLAGQTVPLKVQAPERTLPVYVDAKLSAADRVLFGKYSGTEVKIDGQELLIMKESDIMGIIGK